METVQPRFSPCHSEDPCSQLFSDLWGKLRSQRNAAQPTLPAEPLMTHEKKKGTKECSAEAADSTELERKQNRWRTPSHAYSRKIASCRHDQLQMKAYGSRWPHDEVL
jgi:hypothetical protein